MTDTYKINTYNYSDLSDPKKGKFCWLSSGYFFKANTFVITFEFILRFFSPCLPSPNYTLSFPTHIVPSFPHLLLYGIIRWVKNDRYWDKEKRQSTGSLFYLSLKVWYICECKKELNRRDARTMVVKYVRIEEQPGQNSFT